MSRTIYSYERVAWCYDWLADRYSLGAISRAKCAHVEGLEAGQRVLYVGVGGGEDAVMALRAGARVTCVDVSPKMLARLGRRLVGEECSATLRTESIFDHAPEHPYDVVVANFFLNLYRSEEVVELLGQLRSLLVKRGRLMIADFAPPAGSRTRRMLQGCYYRPVNVAAWATGLGALHPIYDYATYLHHEGFDLIDRRRVPVFGGAGPEFLEALTARRRD